MAAEMMGVNTVRTKLLAFGLGASFAGVAGSLQASYLGATTSDFFDFSISILVLIMIILGGIGNIWGVVLGALTLVYVDKTFLPYLGQQLQAIDAGAPEPGPVQLPVLRDHPRGHDAVPAAGLPAEPPARGRAEPSRPSAAQAEMRSPATRATGQAIEPKTSSVAPPGQDETGPDARAPEVRRGA